MNMYFHELKAYRKSTVTWTFALIGIVFIFMSLYPAFTKDIEEVNKLLEGFPEPVMKALGLELESWGSILGFYSYAFLYITLFGAIQAMILGTSLLSKEVRGKTADFLLSKPVSRLKVFSSKLFAALTSLVITNIIYIVAASVIATLVKTADFSIKIFLMISITLLFVQVIFLAIGMFISVILPKIKSVLSVSLATVFAFFLLGMLASTLEDDGKRYLSPFKFFDPHYIIENSSYEIPFLIAGAGIVLISIVAGYYIYVKKDIHTA